MSSSSSIGRTFKTLYINDYFSNEVTYFIKDRSIQHYITRKHIIGPLESCYLIEYGFSVYWLEPEIFNLLFRPNRRSPNGITVKDCVNKLKEILENVS